MAYIVPSVSEPRLKGVLMHFKTLSLSFIKKATPRLIITITVRIVGFSISFTPFLLSPGVFGLTAPHLRDEDAAFALALPRPHRPCPALHVRAEQREQTAYLTQITLSKLPGPILVLLKRQLKVCCRVLWLQPWPRMALELELCCTSSLGSTLS